MTSPYDTYTSPLAARNASEEMLRIWSPRHKFNTWRRIWLAIAEAQHEVTKDTGSPLVTAEQVEELRAVVERGITDEELARASELERELRHDVMAHVHCLGEQCPKAKPTIHLGCTSQDVVCNADVLVQQQALDILRTKVIACMISLAETAVSSRGIPTLGYTHYQPAQPTTVGRRFAQSSYELSLSVSRIDSLADSVRPRGLRGATGTQAAFVALVPCGRVASDEYRHWLSVAKGTASFAIEHNYAVTTAAQLQSAALRVVRHCYFTDRIAELSKNPSIDLIYNSLVGKHLRPSTKAVYHSHADFISWYFKRNIYKSGVELSILGDEAWVEIEERFLSGMGFGLSAHRLTGQTYPRVIDTFILADLASIASILHKIATDIRLLSNRKEIDEPFGDKQIGSSAMPYKRNPMRCERICGLTRFVMNLVGNAYDTAATQWLERTLDDSSNRRLSLPEAFLALDGALDLMHNVASGLIVHEAMVRKNLMAELPFLATENILMEAVKAGGDRQDLHERIRVHAQEAGHKVKHLGEDNDLIDRLRNDPAFEKVHHLLTEDHLLDPTKYVGRAVEQTERFVKEVVEPLRARYGDELNALEASEPRV